MKAKYWAMGAAGVVLVLALTCSVAQRPPWASPVASTQNITICSSTLQIDFAPGELDLSHDEIVAWITQAATAVATYYGRFPVAHDRILIVPIANQHGIRQGTTWGTHGAFTRMTVGQHTTHQDLQQDWVMTHEMVHTAFPSLEDSHHWIEEGLATYIEPIARVQSGGLTSESVWADMVRDMPKGEPEADDRGLDHTPTWGRTYWGGAMFFLYADVAIRERTNNKKGLQDALRTIVASGKTIEVDGTPREAFAIGDKATGVHVLVELYDQQADKPIHEDLPTLWLRLGIHRTPNGSVTFDDQAPLAAVREAIMHRRTACSQQ